MPAVSHVHDCDAQLAPQRLGNHRACLQTAATASRKAVIYGFPVTCKNGQYHIVRDCRSANWGRKHMIASSVNSR